MSEPSETNLNRANKLVQRFLTPGAGVWAHELRLLIASEFDETEQRGAERERERCTELRAAAIDVLWKEDHALTITAHEWARLRAAIRARSKS